MNRLLSIALENFQVFSRPTEIPLSRLNLFFGPNSAGKSTIIDAIRVMQAFLQPERRDWSKSPYSSLGRMQLFRNHWRRERENYVRGVVTVAVTVRIIDNLGTPLGELAAFAGSKPLTLRIALIPHPPEWLPEDESEGDHLPPKGRLTIEVRVGGMTWLMFEEHDHAALGWPENDSEANFPGLADRGSADDDALITRAHGFVRYDGYLELEHDGRLGLPMYGGDTTEVRQFIAEFNRRFTIAREIASAALRAGHVAASREVPSENSLTFAIHPWKSFSLPLVPDDESEGLVQDSFRPILTLARDWLSSSPSESFRKLAEAAAARNHEIVVQRAKAQDKEQIERRDDLITRVNRALSDHLFLDRGYQVHAAIDYAITADHMIRILEGGIDAFATTMSPACLARLFLEDSCGRRLDFSDVGSGIGYLMPVLVEAYDARDVIVEQPELHLHPALQAALGDVFLDAVNCGSSLIVETHSEHLILRVLRRIRQANSGVPIADELKITPEMLSVFYFDPKPDGSTQVYRLRVNAEGEFIDRWPHGFFEERDRELWDE